MPADPIQTVEQVLAWVDNLATVEDLVRCGAAIARRAQRVAQAFVGDPQTSAKITAAEAAGDAAEAAKTKGAP